MTKGVPAGMEALSAVQKSDTEEAPKLRFPEFVGSWEEKQLGDMANFSKGKGISKADVTESGLTECIRYGELYTKYNEVISIIISKTNVDRSNLVLSQIGDVIIPASGEDRLDIARASCVKIRDAALGSDLNILRGDFNGEFLAYYLSNHKRREIANLAQGNSVVHLYGTQLKAVVAAIPHLPEQKKIAAFLGVVDDKIAALKDRQAGLERYKRGLMQALFSQRLRFTKPDGTPFPDWEEKRLGDVADVNPKSEELPLKFNYVDLESVTNGVMAEVQEIDKAIAPSRAQRLLSQGDILFQTVRPYQKNNLYFDQKGIFVASTGYAQIRAKQNRQYLFQVLHTDLFANKVVKRCTGTSYPAINSNELARIQMPFPHPEEQQKIADALSAMDAKIQAVADQVTQMQSFKKGLLQQMFV